MEQVLSGVSVNFGGDEVLSGLNGSALFEVWTGNFPYTISHPDYYPVESSLVVNDDTTVLVILVANKASLKFRVYSEEKPLDKVALELGTASLRTSQTGIAIFQDLPRFETYAWAASMEGYEDLAGTLDLENDTTVNVFMTFLSHAGQTELDGLRLYPNPAFSTLYLESTLPIRRIEFCDLRGKILRHQEVNNSHLEFDISTYPQGMYMATIYREGLKTLRLKVIKSN